MRKRAEAFSKESEERMEEGKAGTRRLHEALKRLDELREEKERAEQSQERLREEATRVSARLSALPCGVRSRQSRVEHAVLESMDLERDIRELGAEKEGLLKWITPLADGLPPGIRRVIVRLRFLEGMSSAAIAWRLHYSRSYVYKALAEGMAWMGEGCGRALTVVPGETEIS